MGSLSIEEVLPWREDLRASGKKLVFTNGCFDILHAGHARLLEDARLLGDALIVAINDDASVRRLKGETRPLVPDHERAEMLMALESVDRVVLFAEDTPLEAVLALRPDILVKGADWAEGTIVGAPEVESWSGRVVRVPLREGVSTTGIIQRIKDKLG